MRRSLKEGVGQLEQVDLVLALETPLTDAVLLGMMLGTKADAPAIGGLEANAAVARTADVSTFNRPPITR